MSAIYDWSALPCAMFTIAVSRASRCSTARRLFRRRTLYRPMAADPRRGADGRLTILNNIPRFHEIMSQQVISANDARATGACSS